MEKIIHLSLWPADPEQKEKNPKSPDYRITAQIPGGFTEVGAGWKKETTDGKKYVSITLKAAYNNNPGFKLVEDHEPRQTLSTKAPKNDDGFGV